MAFGAKGSKRRLRVFEGRCSETIADLWMLSEGGPNLWPTCGVGLKCTSTEEWASACVLRPKNGCRCALGFRAIHDVLFIHSYLRRVSVCAGARSHTWRLVYTLIIPKSELVCTGGQGHARCLCCHGDGLIYTEVVTYEVCVGALRPCMVSLPFAHRVMHCCCCCAENEVVATCTNFSLRSKYDDKPRHYTVCTGKLLTPWGLKQSPHCSYTITPPNCWPDG